LLVVPAEAGIQDFKKPWIQGQARNDGMRALPLIALVPSILSEAVRGMQIHNSHAAVEFTAWITGPWLM
jgi:hypothetical protein